MQTRPLGRTGIDIAPLVFGGNVFGWTIDEAQSFRVLDAFVDHGFNAIDTADVYSRWAQGNQGGESETIIGEWMAARGNREDMLIATKTGRHPEFTGLPDEPMAGREYAEEDGALDPVDTEDHQREPAHA